MAPGWISALVLAVMFSWMALHSIPADAAEKRLLRVDVACGNGLRLKQASGVPNSTIHDYIFGGFCSFRAMYYTGPVVDGHPPLDARARWDGASSTYTESLHLLASTTYKVMDVIPDGDTFISDSDFRKYRVSTGPEEASFKCDVDPVINTSAHCTLITQHNSSGWYSPDFTHQGGRDGFGWSATHNKPLLAGRTSSQQAALVSKQTAASHPAINCKGLHLIHASGVPGGKTHDYKFNGTCSLYHTSDGNDGLQLTHVLVSAHWDAFAQQAKESYIILTPPAEGGGAGSIVKYTCSADPWLNGNAQCSRTTPVGRVPTVYDSHTGSTTPVFDPITDFRARHPIAAGRANASKAAQLSSQAKTAKSGGQKATISRPEIEFGHHGTVTAKSRHQSLKLAKADLTVQDAVAALDKFSCKPNRLIHVYLDVHNSGGPLPDHTLWAYVHVEEIGKARLKSQDHELPALAAGQTWHGEVIVGTRPESMTKLPGQHLLLVSVGPKNTPQSSLGFVPGPVFRTTLIVPAGHCQHRGQVLKQVKPGTVKATTNKPSLQRPIRRLTLPAVQ